MARIFIHHDRDGAVLGVAAVRTMSNVDHPFQLADEGEGVIEIDDTHTAVAEGLLTVAATHHVDATRGELIPNRKRWRGAI
jgi:hypothetical protein